MNCHGTCAACQAEKAAMADARRVEDHVGRVRFVQPRSPTQTARDAANARDARRRRARESRRARKLQRRRTR